MAELDPVNTSIDTPQSIEQDMQVYKETFESKKDQEISSEFDSISDNLGLTQKSAEESASNPEEIATPDSNGDESQQNPLDEKPVDVPNKDAKEQPTKAPQKTLDEIVADSPEGQFVAPINKTLDTVKPNRLPLGVDFTLGFLQAGTSIASGAFKGVNESLNIIDKAGTFLNEKMGLPQTDKKFKLPDIETPIPTVTGDIVEVTAEFLSGFGFVGRMLKGFGVAKAATKSGKIAESVFKGSAADVVAFDQQQERLSNIVQSFPSLQNPVNEFLATDKDDSFLEGKMKQAIEGVALGAGMEVVATGLVAGVKLLKEFRKPASKTIVTAEEIAAKKQENIKNSFDSILGNIDDERLVYNVSKSVNDVEGLSTKEIKKLAKKGLIPQREESEVVVNLARIETQEDIQEVMKSFLESNKLRNTEARRGVRSFDVTKRSAEDINGFKSLMDRRIGQAFNAEEITAAQQWYFFITDKLVDASRKVATELVSEADVFAFRKIMAIQDATQTAISGARAESGRAVGAWRIPADGSGVDVKAINEVLNQFGGKENIIELAQKIASLGDAITPGQLNNIAKKGAYAANRDAFIEAWTLGLLTSPPTHIRNILSSSIVAVAEIPKKAIQSFIPESGQHLGSIPYYSMGAVRSLNEAFVNSGKAFRGKPLEGVFGRSIRGGKLSELPRERATGVPRERLEKRRLDSALSDSPSELLSQGENLKATATFLKDMGDNVMTPYAYAMDYYGRAVGVAAKALSGGDAFMRTILFRAESNSILANKGISQGLKGKKLDEFVTNGTNNMDTKTIDLAKSFADYNIFITKLGETGQVGQKVLSLIPSLKFAMPFYRTPANLLKWQFHNSPFALLSKDVRGKIAQGGAERGEVLAKIGMGTIIMQLASDQSLRGNITGALSTNISLRKHQEAMGMKPYSIKLGDTWYGYGSLDPIGGIIGFSADLTTILANYESYDLEEQDDIEELVTASTLLFANQVVGKGFLGGATDLFEALSDPDKPKRFVENVVAGFIPTGIAAVARGLDSESKMLGDLTDKLKAKLPYFSKDVPRNRNIWGETISPSVPTALGMMGETGKFLNIAINPFYVSNEIDRPSSKWMLENGTPISMPSKTLTYDGARINLKELPEHTEIYSRFVELRGQVITLNQYDDLNMQDYMDKLLTNNTSNDIFFGVFTTLDEQKSFLDKVVKDYTDAAKKQLREEFKIIDYEITLANEKVKKSAADPTILNILKKE